MIKKVKLNSIEKPFSISSDAFGIESCYYSWTDEEVLISNNLKDLLPYFPETPLNWDYFKFLWINDFTQQHLTPFQNIHALPANSTLSAGGKHKIEVQDRGILFSNNISFSLENSLDEIEKELLNSLRVLESEKSALFLSGGLDSTLLFALIQKYQLNIPALHLEFESEPLNDPYCSQFLKSHFSGKYINIKMNEDMWAEKTPWYENGELAFWNLNFDIFTPLYQWAHENNCTKVFTGLGGDDLFTLNSSYLIPYLKSRGVNANSYREVIKFFKYFRSWGLKGLLHQTLPFVFKKKVKEILNYNTRFDDFMMNHSENSYLEKLLNWRLLKSGIYNFTFKQEQERASTINLKMAYPYINEKIVNILASQPIERMADFPMDKPLLRRLAQRHLPKEFSYYQNKQDYRPLVDRNFRKVLIPEVQNYDLSDWPEPFCNLNFNPSMLSSKRSLEDYLKILFTHSFKDQIWKKKTKKRSPNIQNPKLKNMEM